MKRYQNEGMIENVALTAIYTAVTAPEGLDEAGFTEITRKAGCPTRQMKEGRPFGISKEVDRTEGTGNWRYTFREGWWHPGTEKNLGNFATFEGNYRLLMPETILLKAHGMGTPAAEMNAFIDNIIKDTRLTETGLPVSELENLKVNGIDWGDVFDALAEQRKYDGK